MPMKADHVTLMLLICLREYKIFKQTQLPDKPVECYDSEI